jgi:4-pyridoxolactonase
MKETQVYLLDGGGMILDRFCLYLNAGATGDGRFPVYGVPIDHADGQFIFEAGFEFDHTCKTVSFTKPVQSVLQSMPVQRNLLRRRPSEITHVINSHCHMDHCGGKKTLFACLNNLRDGTYHVRST